MMKKSSLKYTALALAAACGFIYACGDGGESTSSGDTSNTTSNDGGAGQGGNNGGNGTGNEIVLVGGGTGGSGNEGGGCVDLELEQTITYAPSDIVIVIDNSGSMSNEITSVEQNISVNFANIIQASNVDYQVIMVTDHGANSLNVCVGPPLSGTTNCAAQPVEVMGQFYHYDINVQSWDSACLTLDSFYGVNGGGIADQWGAHPNGWGALLRQAAVKVFIEITDDMMNCSWNSYTFDDNSTVADGQTAATNFDAALLALAPFQFGSVADRNYLFYSIVGMAENNPATDPWEWFDPVQTGTCSNDCWSPGTGYQWLSKGTKALRFPVSQYISYDAVFQDIAAGVIEGTALPCDINVTQPPNQTIDWNTVDVEYLIGGMGTPELFEDVGSEAACGLNDHGYWVDTVNLVVHLCPDTCDRVTADVMADLSISIQCGGITE